jgi:serine/threonine protein kinase
VLTFGVPTVGEVLAERYQLQEHINNDAFGRQVWRGVDVVLRRPVAVVLRYPGGDSAVEMLDAAVAASRVVHPHLVDVYDAIDEGTRAYVVREWVDGGSLREYVTEAPLDPERATSVVSAVASAIAAVHASGIAHGNVHPGTVMIGSDGRVVLADARADEATTPDADIRAIGAVLYYSLTGHWPHAEAGANDLPDAVRDPSGALATPRQVRGGVPGHLSDLATDLLDPEVALPSADVLAADLRGMDTDREDEFFSSGGPLDFDHTPFREAPVPEPHRPIAKKLAIGVAGLLVLAVAGLLLVTNVFSSSNGAPSTLPSVGASTSTSRPSNGQPTPLNLTADQVRIVDPPRGSRSEINGAGAMVDGVATTTWHTEHYRDRPDFGGVKPGMGVLIDLGSAKSVSSVKVDFVNSGATVDLRTGNSDPGNSSSGDQQIYNTFKPVADPKVANATIVLNMNTEAPATRYLLVWISGLPTAPDNNGQYWVGISEIHVFVN